MTYVSTFRSTQVLDRAFLYAEIKIVIAKAAGLVPDDGGVEWLMWKNLPKRC
ncbi:MAG: hypothetical protein JRD93_15380 [Deltaproteobacteria bacterium]|nr:hypothetical protein [Deltaproteobacteria bacterium]